jgi:hypothetical protein
VAEYMLQEGCASCTYGPGPDGDLKRFRCDRSQWVWPDADEPCTGPFCLHWTRNDQYLAEFERLIREGLQRHRALPTVPSASPLR